MYSVMKSKWSGPPPFTVLSLTNSLANLYKDPNEDAHWRTMRNASRAWRQRHPKLLEVHGAKSEQDMTQAFDIDSNASCVILTDNIHPKRERFDNKPFGDLRSALVRHLSSAVCQRIQR